MWWSVRLAAHGLWKHFVVDEYFPASGLAPCYARAAPGSGELWPSVLQKAYAKARGSYAALAPAGDVAHALADLSGCPAAALDWDVEGDDAWNAVWDNVCRLRAAGHTVVLQAPGDPPPLQPDACAVHAEYRSAGLVAGSYYALLRTRRVGSSGDGRVVQLRNAWGDASLWCGEWRRGSERWGAAPPALRTLADEEDCSVWMAWGEVRRWFAAAAVCYTPRPGAPDWGEARVRCSFSFAQPCCVAALWLPADAVVIAAVQQADARGTAVRGAGAYQPAALRIIPHSGGDETGAGAAAVLTSQRDVVARVELKGGGPHIVAPRAGEGASFPYTLVILCSAPGAELHLLRPPSADTLSPTSLPLVQCTAVERWPVAERPAQIDHRDLALVTSATLQGA